jgi:hypothetical protein
MLLTADLQKTMSKLQEHLNEMKSNPFLEAWENSYLETNKLKDVLGNLMSDSDDPDQYNELFDIVAGLQKYYTKNTKKVMKVSSQ